MPFVVAAAFLWFGYVITRAVRIDCRPHVWWVISTSAGMIFGNWILFGLHRAFGGFNAASWSAAAVLLVIASVVGFVRGNAPGVPARWFIWVVAVSTVAFAWMHLVGTLATGPDGALYAVEHVWADTPFHASIVTGFADRPMNPLEYPMALGVPLRYPFLADFMTASLVAAGGSISIAFVIVNVILCVAVLAGIAALTERLTGSTRAAVAAPAIFFLLGNLGFLALPTDIASAGGIRNWLSDLPWSYSGDALGGPGRDRLGFGMYMGNPTFMFLNPRRSGTMGLAVGLALLLLIDQLRRRPRVTVAVFFGLMLAAMTRVHIHSAVLAALAAAVWGLPHLRRNPRPWITGGVVALVAVAVQIPMLLGGEPGFAAVQPGWTGEPQQAIAAIDGIGSAFTALLTWSWFWVLNLGALVIAFAWAVRNSRFRTFLVPFAVIFAIGNLVRTQPFDWDNSAWFVWIQVAGAILAADLARRLWQKRRGLAAGFVALACFSGPLTILYGFQDPYHLWSSDDIAMASAVRDATPTNAVILTAGIEAHGHSVNALSGRQAVAGWVGWISTHGLDWSYFTRTVEQIYAGDTDLACSIGVTHVLVSPYEKGWATSQGKTIDVEELKVQDTGPGWTLYSTGCR